MNELKLGPTLCGRCDQYIDPGSWEGWEDAFTDLPLCNRCVDDEWPEPERGTT